MRLREFSEKIPKPMIPIGYRPILWHIMKYYAHYGHKDFVLCLGYLGDTIKNYFVNYHEYLSNDFVFSKGKNVQLMHSDIDDWTITFVDTGINTHMGGRLNAVRKYLEGEEMFLVNYSDVLTDLHLPAMTEEFRKSDKTGMMLVTQPQRSFHVVTSDQHNDVTAVNDLNASGLWINGGYFIFRNEVFNYVENGEDLVPNAVSRMAAGRKMAVYPYEGTWITMDTFKEKQMLDEMYARGETPWEVWKKSAVVEPPIEHAPLKVAK